MAMHSSRLHFFSPDQKNLTRAGMLFRLVLVYLAVNALGLWLAREWLYDRPLFNIDYVLVALMFFWVSRTLAAGALVFLFFTECARYLIPTYFFSRQAFSLLFWIRASANWSPMVLLAGLATAGTMILMVTLLFRRYRVPLRLKMEMTVWVLATAGLLMLLDSVNGTSSLYNFRRTTNLFDVNFSGSPLNVVLRETWDTILNKPAVFTPVPDTATATGRYFSETLSVANGPANLSGGLGSLLATTNRDRLPDKLVVVVFESLSALADNSPLESWVQPFRSLENRYDIESGALDWHGGTFRGEVRELCWQSIDGQQISSLPPSLPAILDKLGYETTAFHGFYKTMYNRDQRYPQLGFDRSIFLDEMRRAGDVPLTGTLFHGAQDSFVAAQVHAEALRPGKRLVYWLTLSSHFPVNRPFARKIATPQELASAETLPATVWAYAVICHRTLENIAEIAADKSLVDCDFVIVGDHPLPATSEESGKYVRPDKIAYLILRHKTSTAPSP